MKLRASYVNVSKKKTVGSKNKKSAKKKLKRNEKSVDLKKKNENKKKLIRSRERKKIKS